MKRAFIVAEIGCNHNGNKELAKRMVLEAKKCNVDAVKFQTFRAKNLISKFEFYIFLYNPTTICN